MNLLPMLRPDSVAVVGASRDANKIGAQILSNLIKADFKGKIFPVNPKAEVVQGLKSYTSIKQIVEKIDLVVIAIPRQFILPVIHDCIEKKVGSIIIISAGFRESDDEGIQLEKNIVNLLKKADIPMLGPNCLGLIIPGINLNASFASQSPRPGNVVFISQSGAFGTAAIDWASNHNLGFSHFISLGNKSILTEIDLLSAADKYTKVIALYLEEVSGGKKFIDAARSYTQKTPLVILKPGKSEKARAAAKSHTGSLTGSDKVITTAFKQSGIIRVDTSQELFNLIKAFSFLPKLKGDKIAIVTNAGGPSIMATDAIETSGLRLAEISPQAQSQLLQYLPRSANVHDPVDLIGDARAERYQHALEIVMQQPTVDACIVILTPQTSTEIEKTARIIIEQSKNTQKPIIASFLGGTLVEKGTEILNNNNIACYHYPEQAVSVLSKMWQFYQNTYRAQALPPMQTITHIPQSRLQALFDKAAQEDRTSLTIEETEQVLNNYGISIPSSFIVNSEEEAVEKSYQLHPPVVLKISAPSIIHKTDQHAVITDLSGMEQIREAFSQLSIVAKRHLNSNIYVQKQIPDGIEILAGIKRDPDFGPVIVIGSGGIYAEIYKDTASRIAPISKNDAENMLKETNIFKVLQGYRNNKVYPLEKVVSVLLALSDIAVTYDIIKEIDINPLLITEHSVYAIDTRIIL